MVSVAAHNITTVDADNHSEVVAGSGSNRLLVVWVTLPFGLRTNTVTATYDGVTMTNAGGWEANTAFAGGVGFESLGARLFWTTDVQDSATLDVVTSGIHIGFVSWAIFTGVHQTSPIRWPNSDSDSNVHLAGLGHATGSTIQGYVSDNDLIYVSVILGNENGDHVTVLNADADTTQLDSLQSYNHPSLPGAGWAEGTHGYGFGDNTDDWQVTWSNAGGDTAFNYLATAVVIRDAGSPTPGRGTFAWGRDNAFSATVQQFPWGDSYNRFADPTSLGVDLLGASVNAFDEAVGIGIGKDGYPYTWGDDGYGLRGDGTSGTPLTSPYKLASYAGCTDVAAGADTVFWLAAGVLYGLGANFYGEFADGTTNPSTTPVTIALPVGVVPVKIAAGDGFLLVLDDDGKIWHSGRANSGQRGDGLTGTTNYTTWGQVGASNGYEDMAAGRAHAIAVRGGTVDTWGADAQGQCGRGATAAVRSIGTPAGVAGTLEVAAYGDSSACRTATDILTFGRNTQGQLGRVTTGTQQTDPTAIVQPLGTSAASLGRRGAQGQSLLWVGADKRLYGAGTNIAYQLDPFVQGGTFFGPANFSTPRALLSDRLGPYFAWASASGPNNGYGVLAGGPRRRAYAYTQVIGD